MAIFPFGRPVLSMPARKARENGVFVLGAYPSALHVQWSPVGVKPIKALPVDNEPAPFWTGDDEEECIQRWRLAVGWDPAWGTVSAPTQAYNGSSGRSLVGDILSPLRLSLNEAWVTDCLNEYHMSEGVRTRLREDIGEALARINHSPSELRRHPSETTICRGAMRSHRERIASELEQAGAPVAVTLGNAALRVFSEIVGRTDVPRLVADANRYGDPIDIQFAGHRIRWYPVCHPGQRDPDYRSAHRAWMAKVAGLWPA